MNLLRVDFINNVSFGGQIRSASSTSPQHPDRPGSGKFKLRLVEVSGIPCVEIVGVEAGREKVKNVPFTNVSTFEVAPPEEKKEEKKPETKGGK